MGFRDEVAAGAHDEMLIGQSRLLFEPDPLLESENRARERVLAGEGTLTEAILTGPAAGTIPIGSPGTNRVQVIAAEDRNWVRAGEDSGAATFFGQSRDRLYRYLYWLYAHHPIAKNIIGHYVNLTIGEGFKLAWKTDAQRKRWREIAKRVRWNSRLRKTIRHTYLLGEWFTLLYPLSGRVGASDDGLQMTAPLNGTRPRNRMLRNLGPDAIETVITRGDPDHDPQNAETPDAETVIGYLRSGMSKVIIAASDVVHHKAEEIANLTRGVSILIPILRYLRFLEKWVEDRYYLNHLRARIPLVRKVQGGAGHVIAATDRERSLPRPGTMMTENMGTDYQFPELNIDARDAADDLKALIMMCATGVQLPTYLITSDPANTNYASLMAADSPTVAHFEGLQEDVWVPDIERMVSELTLEDESQFDVVAGEVIKRNVKTIADSVTTPVDMRIMSRRTAAERMDLDYDLEHERIEEEMADEAGFRRRAGIDDEPTVTPANDKGGRPQDPDEPGDDGQGGRRPRPSDRG